MKWDEMLELVKQGNVRMERGGVRERKHPDDAEHRLQCCCVQWFRMQYPKHVHSLFAVPNGGRRDKVTGAKLKAEGVMAGVADLILLMQSKGYGALLIEMKVKGGKQSPSQKKWQKKVEKDGYRYVVCRSFDEFRNAVEDYLIRNEMKRCGKCGEVLPEEGFFRRRASRDGLQNWCKHCQREYLRGYDRFGGRRASNPDGGDGQQYQLFPVQGNPFRVQFDLNNHNEVLNVLTMLKNRGVIRNVEF